MTTNPLDVPMPAEIALRGDDPIPPVLVALAGEALIQYGDAATYDELRITGEIAEYADSGDGRAARSQQIAEVMRWRPADDGAAEWAMRLLAAARIELGAVRDQATVWRDQIDEWEQQRCADPSRTVYLFEHALLGYGLDERLAGGRKTTALPSGKVSTRSSAEAVCVDDEPAVIAWAAETFSDDENDEQFETYAEIVKTTRKVLVTGLRQHVEIVDVPAVDPETGELIALDDGSEPATVRAARYNGEPVPGVIVVPETFTATVSPTT